MAQTNTVKMLTISQKSHSKAAGFLTLAAFAKCSCKHGICLIARGNEAAQLVPGLTKYRIREMCISGEIPCVKAGRKNLICEQVLIRYLTEPPMPQNQEPGIRKLHRVDT